MERATAIKRLSKLLGRPLAYRVDPSAPDAADREEALTALKIAGEKAAELLKQKELRIKALLDADQEFQQIKSAHEAAKKVRDQLASRGYQYKFTVGTNNGMFFVVKAQGDSWEEIIHKVKAS